MPDIFVLLKANSCVVGFRITPAHLEECDDKGGVRISSYKNEVY
jgi:hypothetical protein